MNNGETTIQNSQQKSNTSAKWTTQSQRRTRLGVSVQEFFSKQSWYYRSLCSKLFPDELLGSEVLKCTQSFEMLRRAKLYLSLRSVENFESLLGLDWRRTWNKSNPNRSVKTLLDLFPSLKFSHESVLPLTARLRRRDTSVHADVSGDYVDVITSERSGRTTVRFGDVCRSHSIWLDPVDSPKELYRWRLRIQQAIAWAYLNGCVPVMMTLTVFHRWHDLKGLLNVLQKSWETFLVTGRPATRRRTLMGLVGCVRRLEITINDGRANRIDGDDSVTNAGWHPHLHVILFVPRDKFDLLSAMEFRLKRDWVSIVRARFSDEFGEEIAPSYLPAFEAHGLHLSRFSKGARNGHLRPVKDSVYLDKIEGYDHLRAYGVDREVAAVAALKDSKIPFDLLCEVSAANIDLWCEYAIATKGLPALQFSRPLVKMIEAYFRAHPDKNPVPADLPPSEVVARLDVAVYRLFYRNFLIPQLKCHATAGYDALLDWVKGVFDDLGISGFCDASSALSLPSSFDLCSS